MKEERKKDSVLIMKEIIKKTFLRKFLIRSLNQRKP